MLEQLLREQQQIVEVDCAGGFQGVLIAAIADGGQMFFVGAGLGGGVIGLQGGSFPAADEVQQIAGPQASRRHANSRRAWRAAPS